MEINKHWLGSFDAHSPYNLNIALLITTTSADLFHPCKLYFKEDYTAILEWWHNCFKKKCQRPVCFKIIFEYFMKKRPRTFFLTYYLCCMQKTPKQGLICISEYVNYSSRSHRSFLYTSSLGSSRSFTIYFVYYSVSPII